MNHTISVDWSSLSNNDLKECAEHLETHAAESDFSNWVGRHPTPMHLALAVFHHCPTVAHKWLIAMLNTNTTPTVHYEVLIKMAHLHMVNGIVSERASEVLKCVNLNTIECSRLPRIFDVLLKGKSFATIEDNWDVLLPIIVRDPIKACIDAAHNGWDVRARLPECVIPVQSMPEYFTACCIGGLIECAKSCNILPDQHETLLNAFVLTMSHNNKSESVLNYLWEAYPNTPWHHSNHLLSNLLLVSHAVAQKIVKQYRVYAPEELEGAALYLTASALSNDCPKLYDLMLPFVEQKDLYKVVYATIDARNEEFLMNLLTSPHAEDNFANAFDKALEMCAGLEDNGNIQWATEIYNKHQNQLLHENINTVASLNRMRKI